MRSWRSWGPGSPRRVPRSVPPHRYQHRETNAGTRPLHRASSHGCRPWCLPRAAQLHLHIVGDSTTELVLDAMEALAPDSTWGARRVRFEHGVVVTGPEIPRVARNHPEEAVSREEAVRIYTRGSAFAERLEAEKGTLVPGQLADLAVLSQDVFTIPAQALPATRSVLTIVGGDVVYDGLTGPLSASSTPRSATAPTAPGSAPARGSPPRGPGGARGRAAGTPAAGRSPAGR